MGIKSKLANKQSIFLGGAHDALTSKIVERAGYDGIWLSGLGVSVAKKGLPDASIVTATEFIDVCRDITGVCDIPLIVDMDSGYGNAINAYYYAREFQRNGAAGLCIEDNLFPKCNSFFKAESKKLENISTMVSKIHAIKDAVDDNFTVIARNEGLIVGLDLSEVLDRSYAYAESGIDALVVHSANWDSLQEYLAVWKSDIPLVIIPTKMVEIPREELISKFNVIIYANQQLRASINASEFILKKILKEGLSADSESLISSMSEVFNYNEMDKLTDLENKFIK